MALISEITATLGLETGRSYFFLFSDAYKNSFDFLGSIPISAGFDES